MKRQSTEYNISKTQIRNFFKSRIHKNTYCSIKKIKTNNLGINVKIIGLDILHRIYTDDQ